VLSCYYSSIDSASKKNNVKISDTKKPPNLINSWWKICRQGSTQA